MAERCKFGFSGGVAAEIGAGRVAVEENAQ
jgi:hypothetical protein